MHRAVHFAMIGAVAAAALTTGAASASADTGSTATGSSAVENSRWARMLLQRGLLDGGSQAGADAIRGILLNTGSFNACYLTASAGDPCFAQQ